MGVNIGFETVVPATKKKIFHKNMIDFFNWLELNDENYWKNGTIRYKRYKGTYLFTMKIFVSFGKDNQ